MIENSPHLQLVALFSFGLFASLSLAFNNNLKRLGRKSIAISGALSKKYDTELNSCVELAYQAGQKILKANKYSKDIYNKSDTDFVTTTDKENERLISLKLRKLFPTYDFIGEEETSENGGLPTLTDKPTWIVDPIDGTTNFVHNFPFSCVSIALVVKREAVLGVVYNPYSVKNCGSFLNGKRIKVSKASSVKESLMVTEFGYGRDINDISKISTCIHAFLVQNIHGVRMMGSGVLNLCYLACGKVDLVYTGVAGEGWKPWDYAAGGLIVTEAGGIMTNLAGNPFHLYKSSMLASASQKLHTEAVNIIQDAILAYNA